MSTVALLYIDGLTLKWEVALSTFSTVMLNDMTSHKLQQKLNFRISTVSLS